MFPKVTVDQGTLKGSTATDFRGNQFFKFQGIPYAKPALGNLRFKAPVPFDHWSGTFDATKEKDNCYSRNPFKDHEVSGSENCLVLNVFTKRLPKNQNDLRPVLFWIHGGAFVWGSSNEELYGPEFLLTEDIVLVTINYRLGIFGFLSFDDPTLEIPGNSGLKDQVLALKWVQKNIDKFGGDPKNVTIFGQSAGAASVHLLVLSSSAKGLFHKAIAQSGCALDPWVQGTRGSTLVAQALDMEGQSDELIYKKLLTMSTEDIFKLQEEFPDDLAPNKPRPFGVVVEQNSKDAFLDDEPLQILLSGNFNRVPYFTGYTSAEGMCFEATKPGDVLELQKLVPWTFGYDSTDIKIVADKLKQFYFGNQEYTDKLIDKKFDLLTDCHCLHGIHLTTLLQYPKTPVFFYKMTLETQLNFFKKFLKTERPGVSHCDDIGYLFKNFLTPEIKPGSTEDVSLTRFVKLWTNFAKFGNPTPEKDLFGVIWKPVTTPNFDYLEIGENFVLKSNPDSERTHFWKMLFVESPVGRLVKNKLF